MRAHLPILLGLTGCGEVEYEGVTHEDASDPAAPEGPVPPDAVIFREGGLVEPALRWGDVFLSEQVCAFQEGSFISGADMAHTDLVAMTLYSSHDGTWSRLPEGELRVVGLYGSAGSYPSLDNRATEPVTAIGSEGSWTALWSTSSLGDLNTCTPDCYYSGFHLELRIPWKDEQPAVACEDYLDMRLEFTWHER